MTDQDDLLPIGLEDALPARAAAITRAMRAVLDTMDAHGYDRVRPPLIEFERSLAGRMQGVATAARPRHTVRLAVPLRQNDEREDYLRATLSYDGEPRVTPFSRQDSSMVSSPLLLNEIDT